MADFTQKQAASKRPKQSTNLTWRRVRESPLSHFHQQLFRTHSQNEQHVSLEKSSSPPTQFIPSLSLPEWTSTTRRWNNSLLAFQRKIEHGSKNKTERERWAFLWWSSDKWLFHRETDSRDTLCSFTACRSKIHCKQTVHWLVLWRLWSVRAEEKTV